MEAEIFNNIATKNHVISVSETKELTYYNRLYYDTYLKGNTNIDSDVLKNQKTLLLKQGMTIQQQVGIID